MSRYVTFARFEPHGTMQHGEHGSFGGSLSWALDIHTMGNARVGIHRDDISMAARLALAARPGMTVTDDTTCPAPDDPLWAHHGFVRLSLGMHVLPQVTGVVRLVAVAPLGVAFVARPASLVAPRCNLPPHAAPFIGRSAALEELEYTWSAGQSPVTVTGSPGIGKSALAMRFGRRLWDEPSRRRPADAVWYVDLAQVGDNQATCASLVGAIAGALKVVGDDVSAEDLGRVMGFEGRCLLIVDNADRHIAELADHLPSWRRLAPLTSVLVTSRERLKMPGEVVMNLKPLGTDEALALFYARGALANVSQVTTSVRRVVDNVVDHLHGNPLAIGLTALRTRSGVLSPKELISRLASGPILQLARSGERGTAAHHQSLRAAVAWSWVELSLTEQTTLVVMAQFPGGLTLESYERVMQSADADIQNLDDLLAKSLLFVEPERSGDVGVPPRRRRFHLYPLVAEFARQDHVAKGAESHVAQARRDHVNYLTTTALSVGELAAEWENMVRLRDVTTSLEPLLGRAAATVPMDAVVRAVVQPPVMETLELRGETYTRRQLEQAVATGSLTRQAQLLLALSKSVTELQEAEKALGQALAIARNLGSRQLMHHALWECALVECAREKYPRVMDILNEIQAHVSEDLRPKVGLLLTAVHLAGGNLRGIEAAADQLPPAASLDGEDFELRCLLEVAIELSEAIKGRSETAEHHAIALKLLAEGGRLRGGALQPETALIAHMLLCAFEDHIAVATTTANHTLEAATYSADGTWLRLPSGETVDVSASPLLARLTARLLKGRVETPGRPTSSHELIEAGWTSTARRPSKNVLRNRLYVAIRELRAKGLEPYLLSNRKGYWLSEKLVWLRREAPPDDSDDA